MKGEEHMWDTLSYIGQKLNGSNIMWAVGGSILLNQFGLVDRPNDIDILVDINVDINDIDRAHELLKSIGHKRWNVKALLRFPQNTFIST